MLLNSVSYNNKILCFEIKVRDEYEFDTVLHLGYHILRHFKSSQPGTVWGCSGIAYPTQKRRLEVTLYKSGVGPQKYEQGLAAVANCQTCQGYR